MKRILATCLSPILVVGCASVEPIQDEAPAYRAKTTQDAEVFQQCVFALLTSRHAKIRQTTSGVMSAESRDGLGFIIEQADGYVTVYKGQSSMTGYLPEWAAKRCNDSP